MDKKINSFEFLDDRQTILLFEDSKFRFCSQTKTKESVYQCTQIECKAKIKLSQDKTKIVTTSLNHKKHTVQSPTGYPLRSTAKTKLPNSVIPTLPTVTIELNSSKNDLSNNDNTILNNSDVGTIRQDNKHIDVETQTDITAEDWTHMKQGLVDKICEKENEIMKLRSYIALLEDKLRDKDKTSPPPVASTSSRTTSHNIGPATHFLIGDSHLRWMGEELSSLLPPNQKVESFFQPGAGFKGVADVHTQSPHLMNPQTTSSVVIYCGTNDVGRSQWDEIKSGLDILITKFQTCKRFCIVGVPLRFDSKKLNYHIVRFNTKLKNYVKSKVPNLLYIQPNNFLHRKHYARDGLHFNNLGKTRMCRRIANMILCVETSPIEHTSVPSHDTINIECNESRANSELVALISRESTFSDDLPKKPRHVNMTTKSPQVPDDATNSTALCVNNQPDVNSFFNKFYTDSGRENSMSDPFRLCSPIPVLETTFNRRPSSENFNPTGQIQIT